MAIVQPADRKLRIFIVHPSPVLTDNVPHGDGLIAHGYIRGLADRGHTIVIAAESVELKEPLPKSVEIHILSLRQKRLVFRRLEYMFKVRRLYDQTMRVAPFDVIHQMNPVFPGLSLALVGAKPPVILGTYMPRWKKRGKNQNTRNTVKLWAARLLESVQQHFATSLILTTPAALERVIDKHRSRKKIGFVTPGIDSIAFGAADHITTDSPKVLFLAHMLEHKGIFVLLDAFDALSTQMPEARLVLAGTGPDYEAVLAHVRAMPSRAKIEMLGSVSRGEIANVLSTCTVYCLPSYGEPFGLSILEAMSVGRAVVTTNVGGPRYMITDDGGRRVAPGDVVGLTSALREILATPGMAASMGDANRRRVEDRFTWTQVVSDLEKIYSDVFARRTSAAFNGDDVVGAERFPIGSA